VFAKEPNPYRHSISHVAYVAVTVLLVLAIGEEAFSKGECDALLALSLPIWVVGVKRGWI
jgi:hypothetical protein